MSTSSRDCPLDFWQHADGMRHPTCKCWNCDPRPDVDHKQLLQKYMDHVLTCEGSDFVFNARLGKTGSYGEGSHEFTAADIAELNRLAELEELEA